ncbi:MAG: pyroglutamyl-peptidase I [Saccharofermentanales bacterium]|jgi:pyroglutamyl-peptidase
MKILLTAFEPFGGETMNSAMETMRACDTSALSAEVRRLEVPTVFYESIEVVQQAIRDFHPDVILCLGQAGGRSALTPERVAINVNDARIPDNGGRQPVDEPIFVDGPAAYFSSLPLKAMIASIQAAGVPASVSNTAGTFVCNHLMYGVLHTLAQNCPTCIGGFMHLPYLKEQVTERPETPSLSLENLARGLRAALIAIIDHH